MNDQKKPVAAIANKQYAKHARSFDSVALANPHNALYDRPALLSLLGEVRGLSVLDVGVGVGAYSLELLGRGAIVTGLDASPEVLKYARKRLGPDVRLIEATLGNPLSMLEEAEFDKVVSGLTLDYVKDLKLVYTELYRVLKPGGILAFSIGHPAKEFYKRKTGSYHNTTEITWTWPFSDEPAEIPIYRHSMEGVVQPLLDIGFRLRKLHEPRPVEQFREHNPAEYEVLMKEPGFLMLVAQKPLI